MNQHALQITNHNCWEPWSQAKSGSADPGAEIIPAPFGRQTCDGDGDPEMKSASEPASSKSESDPRQPK